LSKKHLHSRSISAQINRIDKTKDCFGITNDYFVSYESLNNIVSATKQTKKQKSVYVKKTDRRKNAINKLFSVSYN